jgi:hypothetical protein
MVVSKTRAVSFLARLILCTIFLIVLLSLLGVFDPLPDGELIWQTELNAMDVPPQSADLRWLNKELPSLPLGIQLTAAYGDGEIDSGYGLILGQDDGNITVMISPLGYAAVSQQPDGAESGKADSLLPWQPWPHIRAGEATNELLVTLENDIMTVRVNREWLWESEGIQAIRTVGIIGESFGEEVTIDFQSAEISVVDNNK